MAGDKSLKIKGTLLRRRNVLTREERILRLEKEGRWQPGQSVFGLPKVSTRMRKVRAKKQKAAEPQPEAAVDAASETEASADEQAQGTSEA